MGSFSASSLSEGLRTLVRETCGFDFTDSEVEDVGTALAVVVRLLLATTASFSRDVKGARLEGISGDNNVLNLNLVFGKALLSFIHSKSCLR